MVSAPSRLDRWLYARVSRLPASDADRWLRGLSRAANHGRLWLGVAAVLATRSGPARRAALRGVGSLAVASATTNIVAKSVVGRRRPVRDGVPAVRRLRREPISSSFPSGHSASAAAFATAVTMESPLLGALVAPVAVAVGYSRVHVGVHYPGDVAAGAALGAGVAVATRHWWPVHPAVPARSRPAHGAPALPDGRGLVVVVNPASGAGDADPGAEIRRCLPAAEVLELSEADDLGEVLGAAAGRAAAIGVAGGDGTVAAAAVIALTRGLPLVVFPSGTLNHFARDVGVESIEAAAAAVRAGQAVGVDVAEVGGLPFLNTASIGSYPEMVAERERLERRWGKWPALVLAATRVLRTQQPLSVELDGRRVDLWILFVGNCAYTPRGLSPAWRPSLRDAMLDVQYLRADRRFSRARLAVAALAGVTDRSRMYQQLQVAELSVRCLGGPQRVARDGEPGEERAEFRFAKADHPLVVYRLDDVDTDSI